MREDREFTFEEYGKLIKELAPCMDVYPYYYDLKNDMYYISEKAMERFAVPSNQFSQVTDAYKQFVYEDDMDILIEDLQNLVSGKKEESDIEYRWIGKDGNPFWVNDRCRVIYDENKLPKCIIGCINEIGVRRKADNVSGLKSLHVVAGTLETFCQVAAGGFTLHVGIDNFKVINESYGYEYGNFILRGMADCIKACLGPAQEVYHVAADEFMVVDYLADGEEEGTELYRRICAKIDSFIQKRRYETVFTISAGVLSCKELGGMSFDEFIKLSEFALSHAKELGKNQMYFFNLYDYEMFLRKNTILSTLKESVSADYEGFEVFFGPTILETGEELEGSVETVLSYTMPNGEILTTDDFIPALEESGLMLPVGKWMIDQAIAYCKEEQYTTPGLKVYVKIPYAKVVKRSYSVAFFHMLNRYGVEFAMEDMERELASKIFKMVHGSGINVCIEGMGADEPVRIQVIIE